MSEKQRFVVGGLLLLACVLFVVIGVELWSAVSSDIHTTTRIYGSCPALVSRAGDCPFRYENVVTGVRPNHVPAVLAFVLGGASGLAGILVLPSRSTQSIRTGRLLESR